jgi:hypothetical protein
VRTAFVSVLPVNVASASGESGESVADNASEGALDATLLEGLLLRLREAAQADERGA